MESSRSVPVELTVLALSAFRKVLFWVSPLLLLDCPETSRIWDPVGAPRTTEPTLTPKMSQSSVPMHVGWMVTVYVPGTVMAAWQFWSGSAPVDQFAAVNQFPLVASEAVPPGPYHVSVPVGQAVSANAGDALATNAPRAPHIITTSTTRRFRITGESFRYQAALPRRLHLGGARLAGPPAPPWWSRRADGRSRALDSREIADNPGVLPPPELADDDLAGVRDASALLERAWALEPWSRYAERVAALDALERLLGAAGRPRASWPRLASRVAGRAGDRRRPRVRGR